MSKLCQSVLGFDPRKYEYDLHLDPSVQTVMIFITLGHFSALALILDAVILAV